MDKSSEKIIGGMQYAEKKNFVHIGGTACGDFFDYAKSGICKSEKAGIVKNKNDCLFRINHQYLNHHWNIKAKTQTRSNARSTEFRFGEHHEERVGTNKI